jgi:hypothetical protein
LNEGFIFLALVIPGSKEPRKQMNIYLHPLIEELKELWQGVVSHSEIPILECEPLSSINLNF